MKLNLGCGSKKLRGWINCDIDKKVNPDKIVNLNNPLPFKSNSVEEILLDNVVEHLHVSLDPFFDEISRVLKRNGTLHLILPNFFRWKARVHYFFGFFEDCDGWEINHSYLISYSDLRAILRNKGFEVPKKGFIETLLMPEINIIIRKREDL
jgi:predicted SAM-dependent methyltransferase